MRFDDEARLAALEQYDAVAAPPSTFNDVARVASKLSKAPIALVTLLAETKQLFKGAVNFNATEAPREHAFCEATIRLGAPLVVPDLSVDERFRSNPYVTGEAGLRFYCGVPVRTPDGHALGTLCVLDTQAREVEPDTVALLESLAHQVEAELEVRRRLSDVEEQRGRESADAQSRELLAAMVAHDLRSPLSTILLSAEVLEPANDEARGDLESIVEAADRMRRLLRDFLDISLMNAGALKLRVTEFSLNRVLHGVAQRLTRLAHLREQTLVVESTEERLVRADADLIERVVTNLVGNALSHGPAGLPVTLTVGVSPTGGARVEVLDEGTPITAGQRVQLFQPRVRGAGAAEGGYGLGLAFARMAIEAHRGTIGTEPRGERGNRFFFEIP